jgi:hypothetical protein
MRGVSPLIPLCSLHNLTLRVHAASLHALGTSLADIAAFMQEVELDFGMNLTQHTDRLGIERLRLLARRMQCIDSGHQQVEDDSLRY